MSKPSRRRSRRERHQKRDEGMQPTVPPTGPPVAPGDPLPQDIDIAHQMIRELTEQLRKSRRNEDQLRRSIDDLIRRFYGPKTEKVNENQLLLFAGDELQRLGASAPSGDAPDATPPEDDAGAKPRKGAGRKGLPKNLPRRRVVQELPPSERICPCCAEVMQPVREEVSEQLDYRRASLEVVENVRVVYGCARKCDEKLAIAPKQPQPIDKGLPGPGLLAHIVGSKYGDHLPLYRLEKSVGRNGVAIGRSTLCGWIAGAADLVEAMVLYLKAQVLRSFCVATDETGVLVLDRANGRTFKGRIWVFCGDRDHPWLVYDYTPTRARDGPETFLGGYRGILQADGYNGYDGIYAPGHICELGCWMHGRRYWFNASLVDPAIPMQALAMIRVLYEVERAARGLSPEERYALRQDRAVPVLNRMEEWLQEVAPRIVPKSPTGDALRYTKNQWKALRRYTEDGRLEIDNGRSERALKLVAIGRRNWLFAGSPEGGRRAANLYSLTGSCMLNDIDPEAYLQDLFRELPTMAESQFHEWTPLAWSARQPVAQA